METRARAARVNPSLIFDNTPLSHFARAGRLSTLEAIVNPYQCMIPVEVRTEILAGIAELPDLADVLTADWLNPVELSEVRELAAFARYKTQLGGILVRGSLWLVVQGVRQGELNRSAAESLADELRATDMRLPTDGRGLFAWAYEQGILP